MEWAEFLDQYGLPIVMLIALAAGRFVPGFIYSERKKELDEANEEIKRLNMVASEQWVPAFTQASEVVKQAMDLLNKLQKDQAHRDWEDLQQRRFQDRQTRGD